MQFYIKKFTIENTCSHSECFPENYPKFPMDMINNVDTPFTMEEVQKAVNQPKGNDALGPDGYPARSY